MSRQPVMLVVEDDPLTRMFICEVLSDHGILALSASSADEAFGILQNRHDVETLLTDIVMPGTLDGLGLVSEVRRRWPHIHTIVASGRMPAAAAGNASRTLFLAKPFDQKTLLQAITQTQLSHA